MGLPRPNLPDWRSSLPIWRSPTLEALLQASLDEDGLTEVVIARLVDVGAAEGEQLDFKLNPHLSESGPPSDKPDKGWSAEQEFAKDVCALANHLGGVIFIGVKDDKEVAIEATPTVEDPGAVEQRMRQALSNFSSPPPRFQAIAIEADDGGYYLGLIVPPSTAAPHAVRDGADTRWLLEHEVAERYLSRFSGRAQLDTSRSDTIRAGLEAFRTADENLWLYLAIVPESPSLQRLDRPAIAAMTEWWHAYGFVSPLGRILDRNGTPTPAPGRITITGYNAINGKEETDPRGTYVEIYADGRAFAASPINVNTGGKDHSAVGELTLADDMVLLADVGVSWASHQAGSWGTAEVVIGLGSKAGTPAPFRTPSRSTSTTLATSDGSTAPEHLGDRSRHARRPTLKTGKTCSAGCESRETQQARSLAAVAGVNRPASPHWYC